MSTYRAKNLWTAFITAFFALLAALGLAGSTASATEATVTEPAATTHKHTGATAATANTPSVRWTLPRDRALPPTMKQRIRAEAHGSSPATRHLSADTADTANTTSTARASHGAPAGDASLLPP
ncbi:DUF6344 domain-containing protein [Streptomyces sp. NBC_01260]|uniref:DUF6344 domain-containing protein n=1 Tax=unclassified Streptomyces TaxID=2593676 RepID=UPI000F4A6F50|nr:MULTISPECIES: DUF6344 domain-containing protein [unclassified Streptomyces]MCX4771291.1 DUF6344 domain-containing protein [Streptomyces sp. NBC_01285]ROQ81362.1 hypothetical protein EDD95_0925 [Streptomyces sp. CEV 2-1]RPK47767.1 hypothetical protein EES39_11500 [Streptomyces sp. ADI92-24]